MELEKQYGRNKTQYTQTTRVGAVSARVAATQNGGREQNGGCREF
jgi:hypothetical protein